MSVSFFALSLPCETPVELEMISGRDDETEDNVLKKQRSHWQAMVIGILIVLFTGLTGIIFNQIKIQQSLSAKLNNMEEELFAARNNTEQFLNENYRLKRLLNSTYQNLTILVNEYGRLKLDLNTCLHNFIVLNAENTQLSLSLKNTLQEKTELGLLLNNTLQEKTQLSLSLNHMSQENTQLSQNLKNTLQDKTELEEENKELEMILNSTLENCDLLEEENRQVKLLLNESLHTIAQASAKSEHLRMLLDAEQQTSMQLEAENQLQRSVLFSDKLSFLWSFCNRTTFQCSRCQPGWAEHNSRCFLLSKAQEKWEEARRHCLDMGGDLAVVLNAEDQAFLTNMTYKFVRLHPEAHFLSAWIGLHDMVKEGTFKWVNGFKVNSKVTYWKERQPNNAVASWDKGMMGQDCAGIVPPRSIQEEKWLNSWDDIICVGKRHYLCETTALMLS